MPKILTTPPLAEPLSLSEVKAHLRIMHADDDAYIASLITAARNIIEQRYDICLMSQSWSVFSDHWPEDNTFHLPLHPILSIEDIKVFGEDDVAATIDPSHYFLDKVSMPARLVLRDGRAFPPAGRKINGIEVKLVAGFSTVPQSIKQALLIFLAELYATRGDIDGGKLPISAQELMTPYRQVRLT